MNRQTDGYKDEQIYWIDNKQTNKQKKNKLHEN